MPDPGRAEPSTPSLREGGRGLGAFVADPTRFADAVWGRAPLLTRAADLPPARHGFDAAAVDELLSRRGLRTPFLRMARDGATVPAHDLTLGGGVGASIGDQVSEDRVLRLFAEGATIVLQALHRTWAPVSESARRLAADLGHPVQANAYVTPPQNRGFDDHYDVHDVFVVQVQGEKHWRVRPPVLEAPLRTEPWTDRREAVRAAAEQEPVVDAVLRPGDCLYLPRGWLHSATALGGTSIHLTFGVHVWTRRTLVDDLLAAAGPHLDEAPTLREALPVGVDVLDAETVSAARDELRENLIRAIDAVTDEELAAALAGRARAAERAEPLDVLAQRDAAEAEVGPRWRLRHGLAARWARTSS
ncbi:MAG: cupin-like domain-containing protein, partial [Micrococcales bacterium]|nr:cupin-like domain-containing protein [Micrococcales bacterium]